MRLGDALVPARRNGRRPDRRAAAFNQPVRSADVAAHAVGALRAARVDAADAHAGAARGCSARSRRRSTASTPRSRQRSRRPHRRRQCTLQPTTDWDQETLPAGARAGGVRVDDRRRPEAWLQLTSTARCRRRPGRRRRASAEVHGRARAGVLRRWLRLPRRVRSRLRATRMRFTTKVERRRLRCRGDVADAATGKPIARPAGADEARSRER